MIDGNVYDFKAYKLVLELRGTLDEAIERGRVWKHKRTPAQMKRKKHNDRVLREYRGPQTNQYRPIS